MPEFDLTRAYYETLLETERLPKAELARYQSDLVARLLRYAGENVPFYRDRPLPLLPIEIGSPAWLATPTLDRSILANRGNQLRGQQVPRGHGESRVARSSGSTGEPVQLSLSQLDSIGRVSPTYRMFTAYDMDPSRPLVMIRNKTYSARWTDDLVFRKWAHPWLPEDKLGDRIHLDIDTPPADQLDRLIALSPVYVHTLPWNILRLGLEARRSGKSPRMPILISVAEYLSPEVAALAAETFGSRVINILASSEAGPIAIQCPSSPLLHIQSEVVLAEILNEKGRPCAPGEVGELVVTPLYNYAMPLIRYRTGDYVEQGGKCPCGRSLPTIQRFVGRKQHRFKFADGSEELPAIDRVRLSELIGHDAWQLAQIGSAAAELRHESTLSIGMSEAVRMHLHEAIGDGWSFVFSRVEKVATTSGGKRHFCVNAMSLKDERL